MSEGQTPTPPGGTDGPPGAVEALARGMVAGGEAVAQVLKAVFSPVVPRVTTERHGTELLVNEASHRIAVGFDVSGEARARMLLLADTASAGRMAAAMLKRAFDAARPVDDSAREALAELGNILASAFLNGLARRARMVLVPSVPTFAEDTAAQFAALRLQRDFAYVVRFDLPFAGEAASGLFLVAPESDAVDALRRSLLADVLPR